MKNKLLKTDLGRCRADMAELLATTVAATRKLQQQLDVATAEVDLDADPAASVSTLCGLLLRKARIHAIAALRANETNNLHSLAVQMRPVLECAGQIVFFFHHLIIAPDFEMSRFRATEMVGDRLDADHFQTLRRRSRGDITPEELREAQAHARDAAAALVGAPTPKRRRVRNLNQADKVASLRGGPGWYRYLSDRFSHAKTADWRGLSLHGGVISNKRIEDEYAFFSMLDYLVNVVAVMNAHAALCPVTEASKPSIETILAELGDVQQSSRAIREGVHVGTKGEPDDTRTD